jgi:hypothetical protein
MTSHRVDWKVLVVVLTALVVLTIITSQVAAGKDGDSNIQADLIVKRVKVHREWQKIGVVVKNVGGSLVDPGHYTAVWVNGEQYLDVADTDLGPGYADTYWLDQYLWEGQTVTLTVCADHYNTIEESDEDNNCLTGVYPPNRVYFRPQHPGASFSNTAEVDIVLFFWEPMFNFGHGQVGFTYDPMCADITDREIKSFVQGTWVPGVPGKEWITFTMGYDLQGEQSIASFTLHSIPGETCATLLDFVEGDPEPSRLVDDRGNEIPVTWENGMFWGNPHNLYLPSVLRDWDPLAPTPTPTKPMKEGT